MPLLGSYRRSVSEPRSQAEYAKQQSAPMIPDWGPALVIAQASHRPGRQSPFARKPRNTEAATSHGRSGGDRAGHSRPIRTRSLYECVARVFLEHRVARCEALELELLSAADVSEFECQRLDDGAARGQVAKLRPFLVYLHVTGRINTPLRWAIPKVADMRTRDATRA